MAGLSVSRRRRTVFQHVHMTILSQTAALANRLQVEPSARPLTASNVARLTICVHMHSCQDAGNPLLVQLSESMEGSIAMLDLLVQSRCIDSGSMLTMTAMKEHDLGSALRPPSMCKTCACETQTPTAMIHTALWIWHSELQRSSLQANTTYSTEACCTCLQHGFRDLTSTTASKWKISVARHLLGFLSRAEALLSSHK